MKRYWRDLTVFLWAGLLAHACAGGGDQGDSPVSGGLPVATSVAVLADRFAVDCAGDHCGASSEGSYAGQGVGVWFYRNSGLHGVNVPIQISGLNKQTVTLVYTNEGIDAVPMPAIALGDQSGGSWQGGASQSRGRPDPAPAAISELNERLAQDLLSNKDAYTPQFAKALPGVSPALSVGASKTITDPYRSQSIALTLQKRVATQDGAYQVNFWVENNEFGSGRITAAVLDRIANYFAVQADNNVYALVSHLIGKPWGEHGYVNLIDGSQDINIVFYNSNSGGWAGYYAASDQYLRGWYPRSNEWLAFYMASEGLYENNYHLDGAMKWATSTLAHELTHMVHFYQRYVALGKGFDVWLNELAAMGMEDLIDTRVFNESYSTTQIMHYPNWISAGTYNCRIDQWLGLSAVAGCNSYAVAGSFGAFMLRQHGVNFYKGLFASTQSKSWFMVDEAIRRAGGSGYQDALRRWGASIAMLPLDHSPLGHGYSQRLDGGFELMGFDGASYRAVRRLPTSLPAMLAPLAHFPVERRNVSGIYQETVSVPPACSVTVIIQ